MLSVAPPDAPPVCTVAPGLSLSAGERAPSFAPRRREGGVPAGLTAPDGATVGRCVTSAVRRASVILANMRLLNERTQIAHALPSTADLLRLSRPQRELLEASLVQLAAFADREQDALHTMLGIMRAAANISGGDRALFVDLLRFVFCTFDLNPSIRALPTDAAAMAFDFVADPVGSRVEDWYANLFSEPEAARGFHPAVIDTEVVNSTVTHHFISLLSTAFVAGQSAGAFASRYLDDSEANPGDVRNGLFASMLGAALRDGRVTVNQTVDLMAWALDARSTDVPWGLSDADYTIENWLR